MENCKSKADAIEKVGTHVSGARAITDSDIGRGTTAGQERGGHRRHQACISALWRPLWQLLVRQELQRVHRQHEGPQGASFTLLQLAARTRAEGGDIPRQPRIEPAMLVHPEQVRGDAVGWPSEMGYQQPAPVAAPSYGMPAPPLAAPAPPQPPQHHAHPPPAPRVPAQRAITAPPAQNAPAPQPQRAPPQPQRAAPAAQPNRPPARAPQQQQQAPPPRKMPVPRAHTVAHAPQVASAAAAIASTSAAASKATNAQALHTAGVEAAELAAIPWSDDIDDGPYEDPLLGVYEDDISLALHDDSGFAEAVELAEAQEAKRHERQEAMCVSASSLPLVASTSIDRTSIVGAAATQPKARICAAPQRRHR